MPTILFIAGWRFYFGPDEYDQPIHIHAEKGDTECKFWIDDDNFEITSALEYNITPEARRVIKKIIYNHFDYLVSQWNIRFQKN